MMNLAAMWSDGPWSPVEVHAELPAPPDEVFEVLADPETYPEWLIGAQRIRHDPIPRPVPSSTASARRTARSTTTEASLPTPTA